MNIIKKFLLIIICITMLWLVGLFNLDADATFIDDLNEQSSTFIEKGQDLGSGIDVSKITKNFKGIGKFLTMIGAGVLVAVTAYLGIQYLISPPDKQGALKEKLVGVVVAGIVIFGAYGIWKAVVTIVAGF